MKAFLLAFLALSYTTARAQMQPPAPTAAELQNRGVEQPQPFKGATVIVAHTTDSATVAYAKLARLLLSAGYSLEKTDKELGFISAGYRQGTNRAIEMAPRFVIIPDAKGARIEARANTRMPGFSRPSTIDNGTPVSCRGSFGNPVGVAWEELVKLMQGYSTAALFYKKA